MAIALLLVAVGCGLALWPGSRRRRSRPLLVGTGAHWRRNYSRRAFLRLGAAGAAAAALAYSGADEAVDRLHGRAVKSPASDALGRAVKPWGERPWFLLWLGMAAVDAWVRTSGLSRWGRRNFEAMTVGLPLLWTVQRGLGGDRPSAQDPDPRWHPLRTDKAASGHAFMGAVPWLNLARAAGRPLPRSLATLGSTLTGWSRLNDRHHYLSQVLLGWTIAWNAVDAVNGPIDASSDSTPALEGEDEAQPHV